MSEEWRDVVGYEGIYEVSDQGQVRRISTVGGARAGYVLNPDPNARYLHVTLSYLQEKENRTIHSLVAEAFLGSPPGGYQVNHKNGEKHDNRVENLEWVTASQNHHHARWVLGRLLGENHPQSKLTKDDVRSIRRLYASGDFIQQELAERFGIDRTTVSDITRHKHWRHV